MPYIKWHAKNILFSRFPKTRIKLYFDSQIFDTYLWYRLFTLFLILLIIRCFVKYVNGIFELGIYVQWIYDIFPSFTIRNGYIMWCSTCNWRVEWVLPEALRLTCSKNSLAIDVIYSLNRSWGMQKYFCIWYIFLTFYSFKL